MDTLCRFNYIDAAAKSYTSFAEVLGTSFGINNIFGTDISASIRPFQSPLFPFILIGLLVMYKV
jgi:hypothetical protein